jgi:hypothetical protein
MVAQTRPAIALQETYVSLARRAVMRQRTAARRQLVLSGQFYGGDGVDLLSGFRGAPSFCMGKLVHTCGLAACAAISSQSNSRFGMWSRQQQSAAAISSLLGWV